MAFDDDAVKLADTASANKALQLIKESTNAYDAGVWTTSLAGERCTIYSGWCIHIDHPKLGKRVIILGGVNHRVWGTSRGRAEIAQGTPNMSAWDPSPGTMFPAHVELTSILVTNSYKPRETPVDSKIREAIKAKG